MTINLTVNGVVYPFPEPDDENWGQNVTDWAQAVTGGMLQKAGGNFSLTADANFGATYGLVSTYFKSRASNISTAGAVRLAVGDSIGWRNNANSGNLLLAVDASDLLTFNGTTIQNTLSVSDTSTIDLNLAADVLSAAIVAGSITNSMVNASAAIALSKLAATTASRALVSDGSGFVSAATTTATEIGYVNGVTSAIQTQLDAKVAKSLYAAKGTILGASAAATPVALAVGTDGQVLTADSGETSGLGWTSPLTNPMDGGGQMIYGAGGGAATKLAAGSANQVLQSNGTSAPTWVSLVNANIDASAAIAFSKLAALASANILVGSAGNVATSVAVTGDVTLSNAGVTAIAPGVIVDADISASAAIAYSKLAALTASRALVSSAGGAVSVSTVTSTELGYLAGVTSPTGSGALVLANTPSLNTPNIGAATGDSVTITGSFVSSVSTNYLLKYSAANDGVYRDNATTAYWLMFGGTAYLKWSSGLVELPFGARMDDDTSAGGSTALNYYKEDSTSTTFTWNNSGSTSGSISIAATRIGRIVTLTIPAVTAATNAGAASTAFVSNTALNAAFRPGTALVGFIRAVEAGTAAQFVLTVNTNGTLSMGRNSGAALPSETAGTSDVVTISYSV